MTGTAIWQLALVLVLVLFPASAFAQVPSPTGSGPVITASLGYSYMNLPIPSSTRIGLNGVDASVTANFRSRFGAKFDLNYVRAANVLGTGHHSDVLSYMAGPVFYPINNDRLAVYVQGLVGGFRADGVIPNGTGGFGTAFTEAPAFAIGGGIERSIFSRFAIRAEADYMYTSSIDFSGAFRTQNDLRISGSLVYRWNWHWEGRSKRGRP
jgi:hypothetical protein